MTWASDWSTSTMTSSTKRLVSSVKEAVNRALEEVVLAARRRRHAQAPDGDGWARPRQPR